MSKFFATDMTPEPTKTRENGTIWIFLESFDCTIYCNALYAKQPGFPVSYSETHLHGSVNVLRISRLPIDDQATLDTASKKEIIRKER
jgi:hypothetical protein